MNVANTLTIVRILMVPLIVWLLLSEAYVEALVVFAVASITDAADGWLARKLDALTELGASLDPLADKALLVSTYATLGVLHMMPTWLVIGVISRDVLIIGGLMLAWQLGRPLAINPVMVSKANTVAQIGYMVLVLAQLSFGVVAPWFISGSAGVVGVLTLVSGVVYMRTWVAHMSGLRQP